MNHKNELHGTEKKKSKGMGTMDKILVFCAFILVAFTVTMIVCFWKFQCIPDTLCTCVFVALTGECGVMGWIKTAKLKNKESWYTYQEDEVGG